MLDKCVNPQCDTPLLYLRDGKVIRVDETRLVAASKCRDSKSIGKMDSVRKVEHFWLCGSCLKNYDVVFRPETGICVFPRQKGVNVSRQRTDGLDGSEPSPVPKKPHYPPEARQKPLLAAAVAA